MYCSITDILQDITRSELINLVNDENLAVSDVDLTEEEDAASVRIIEQINSADDEINSYLRSRYTSLPLAPVPARVVQISKSIAIYNLYKRRLRLNMPESIVTEYHDRIKELEKIQKGVINLDVTEVEAVSDSEFSVNKITDDRLFGKETLEQY